MFKKTRLKRLTTDYENLIMHDDESITDFYGLLCDITNECFALGKIYTDAELVRKVLCSLLMKFMSKATSIEECRNLDEMQLDELIGSLQTFKLNLKRWEKKPGKGLALKHEVISEPSSCVASSDECANTLKKKGKAMAATLSESDDSESGGDDINEDDHFLAFTNNQEDSRSVSSDDSNYVYKNQPEAYDKMHESWLKAIKKIKSLEYENCPLTEDKKMLTDKLNAGSYKLDEVLGQGKSFGDKTSLRFSPGASTSEPGVTTFIKSSTNCLVAHTSLLAFQNDQWYFDNGCSRHMKSNKSLLTNLEFAEAGHVTYGDGKRGKILGKGSLAIPVLNDVFYVEGLKANLISITQICDKGCVVKFSKNLCQVLNDDGTSMLEGKRSNDNCYLLTKKISCLSSKSDCVDIWHKKLGHMNYKDLVKLSKKDVVKGLPKLVFQKGKVCGLCQQEDFSQFSHEDDIDDLMSPTEVTTTQENVPTPSSSKDVTTLKSDMNTSTAQQGSLSERQGLELIVDLFEEIT
ncbi:uncharacterized protein LOC116141838 [Pistacia vera]|uniref:uncharacterized protein LOC116141838 n=1 Tax=Pistacia vera TaxID=55513 RepID=UPI001263E202|nr:uncharacterized protein LOC116141838 [Pistacia vera]